MSSANVKPKFGAGSFKAWLRQGLSELRNALYPESNVSRQTEPGMWGTQTQGEIADDRRKSVLGPEMQPGVSNASRIETPNLDRHTPPATPSAPAAPEPSQDRSNDRAPAPAFDPPAQHEPASPSSPTPPEPPEPERD